LTDFVNEARGFEVEIKQSDYPERAYYEA